MLAGTLIGIRFDDPVISTVAAVIAPFYLIAIVFPEHKRHIERARIYPVFIAAMFVSVRLPWFLIPLAILFLVYELIITFAIISFFQRLL